MGKKFQLLSFVLLLAGGIARAADQGSSSTSYGTNAGGSQTSGATGNTSIGENANMTNTTSDYITAIGFRAGESNTASDNTFIGALAGLDNVTGVDLTYIGNRAGYNSLSVTASDNTFLGSDAGRSCTECKDSTLLGENAAYYLTTGSENTVIGQASGLRLTEGEQNTFVGNDIASVNTTIGHNNVGLGYSVMAQISGTSSRNTFVGAGSGYDTGDEAYGNTGVGADALANSAGADWNTFLGAYSGWYNNYDSTSTTAHRNTGVGAFAGYIQAEGADNVWLGAFSGTSTSRYVYDDQLETSAESVTGVGTESIPTGAPGGEQIVNRSAVFGAFANASENEAVALGYGALATAQEVVVIGSESESSQRGGIAIGTESKAHHSGAIVLGHQAQSVLDNSVVFGNSSTVSINPSNDSQTSLGTAENCNYSSASSNWSCNTPYIFTDLVTHEISNFASQGTATSMVLWADYGEDYDDRWDIQAADSGALSIGSYANSSFDTGSGETPVRNSIFSLANNGELSLTGNFNVNSDRRLKTNISNIINSQELLAQIQPVTYNWRTELKRSDKRQYGVIAQQVEKIIPELVSEDKSGTKSVNYQGFIPLLIEQVKAQKTLLEHNQKNIDEQRQLVAKKRQVLAEQQLLIEQLKQLVASSDPRQSVSNN